MTRKVLILLDKTIVQLLFWVLAVFARLSRAKRSGSPIRIDGPATFLVVRPGGLGDAIMAVPFLRSLRQAHPEARIRVACVRKNKKALDAIPFINDVIAVDRAFDLFGVFETRYSAVFDLEPFRKTSAVLTYLTRARVRVGFDTNRRRVLYTHLVTYQGDQCFEATNCTRQLRTIGLEVSPEESADLCFDPPHEARQWARTTLHSKGVDASEKTLVAVAPGVLKLHHRWSMTKWARVVDRILEGDPNTVVLLVGGPRDRHDAEETLGLITEKERVLDLVGTPQFSEALAVLEYCSVLLACDGGVVYMGAAMGCATVSLWGPGVMERFKPPGDRHLGVRKDYPCIPCVTWDRLGEFPSCPYDRKCYKDLTATEVFGAYEVARQFAFPGGPRAGERP